MPKKNQSESATQAPVERHVRALAGGKHPDAPDLSPSSAFFRPSQDCGSRARVSERFPVLNSKQVVRDEVCETQ
jgi:hypothetical protein